MLLLIKISKNDITAKTNKNTKCCIFSLFNFVNKIFILIINPPFFVNIQFFVTSYKKIKKPKKSLSFFNTE